MIAGDPQAGKLAAPVRVGTGGAPPSPALLERLAELGMDVTHLYGLTETYGPSAISEWQPEWDALADRRAGAAQGPPGRRQRHRASRVRVVDDDGSDVPADAQTIGEIAIRGNDVMLGYYRDEEATADGRPDGWFRTGDLGVMHPDGYVEIRDRAKDMIISGGENIASVEVERALTAIPRCSRSRSSARPDEKWGEVPVAFVTLREGAAATRRRADRARARAAGALQGAEAHRVRAAAEDLDRQGAEERAARPATDELTMAIDFEIPADLQALQARIRAFIADEIIPLESDPRRTPHGPTEELRRALIEKAR